MTSIKKYNYCNKPLSFADCNLVLLFCSHFFLRALLLGSMRCEKKYITSKGVFSYDPCYCAFMLGEPSASRAFLILHQFAFLLGFVINEVGSGRRGRRPGTAFPSSSARLSNESATSEGCVTGESTTAIRAMSTRPRKALPDSALFFPSSFDDAQQLLVSGAHTKKR